MKAPGVYRALCIRPVTPPAAGGSAVVAPGVIVAIPTLFGTAEVPVEQAVDTFPAPNAWGWVIFEGADTDYPVWLGLSP